MYKNLFTNRASKCHHEKTQLFLLIKNGPQLGTQNGQLLKDLVKTKRECEAPKYSTHSHRQESTFFEGYFCDHAIELSVRIIDTENEQNTIVRAIS